MLNLTFIPITSMILLLTSERSVWSTPWSWEPPIVLSLALLFGVYAVGAFRRGAWNILRWRHASFFSGWFTLAFALLSPLHELGEQLFSAHMLQHEILILVSAPLISAAHPAATCLWAFAPRQRIHVGSWIHSIEGTRLFRFMTRPLVAWLLEAFALWIWHVPALYQATLTSDWVHAEQHLSFFLTAVLFWSALYGVGRSAMSYGAATFYVFGTAVHCSALGALLTFSVVLWYPAYATTTQSWGLMPLEDQQLGGLIMWIPSAVVFILIGLVLFANWVVEAGSRQRHSSLQAVLDAAKGGQQ
jgi:cytochrome c oxidase assembly factor CtaG